MTFTALRRELGRVAQLSLPAVLSQVGLNAMGVIDTLMLGHVGVKELAAAALGNVWEWTFLCLGSGLVMGIDPLISQAHGRGDGRGTALALQRGIVLALLLSIPIGACVAATRPGLMLLGQDGEIAELAAQYNLWRLPSVPSFLVFGALRHYLQGRTLTAPPTIVMWIGNVVHAALSYTLVFGRLGLPALGIGGAAMAESITLALVVAGLVAWIRVFRLHENAWRPWRRDSFDGRALLSTVRIGLPIGMQIAFEAWAFSLATLMAGWIDRAALGSHQIVLNLAALAFMIPLGVSQGAATRVGNLIGRRDTDGLRLAIRASLLLGAGVMLLPAAAFTLLRHQLPALYSNEAEVVALAARLLPIAAAFQLFDGAQAVAAGVLRGMGRPDAGAVLALVGHYVVALPLAYLCGFVWGLGLTGIWLALALGLVVVALALLVLVSHTARHPVTALQLEIARRHSTRPPPSHAAGPSTKSPFMV